MQTAVRTIFDSVDFPGWDRFPAVVAGHVERRPDFAVLDLGGGANPMLPAEAAAGVSYTLLDIDAAELAKASRIYDRLVCADAGMPTAAFAERLGAGAFDLVCSHMFLEHVTDPDQVHRNVFAALKPGGVCIHAYPVRNNLPLAVNALLPERLGRRILRVVQPGRDLDGKLGKFPAFYRRCHAPSAGASRYFRQFGFRVVRHDGFAGHDYYLRFPVVRSLGRLHRRLVVATQIPWICFSLLVLQKPELNRRG